MKKLFTLSLLILLAFGLQAQSKNIAYQDETVRFTVITDGVIRMEYAKDIYRSGQCFEEYFIRIALYEDNYALRFVLFLSLHIQFALKKVDTFSASFSMSSMKSNMNSPNVSSISPA